MKQTIKIGDKVRSYDFPGFDNTTFVEGTVVGIGAFEFGDCDRYQIRVERVVVQNQVVERNRMDFVFPPVNGTPSWTGRIMNGVELI